MDTNQTNPADSYFQHTLREPLTIFGLGLHSGRRIGMRIKPAEPNSGIVFMRRDVDANRSEIAALWHNVIDTRLCTTLGNGFGVQVSTVEHLMAALYACGVDNATIVLDGPEVPIFDGSALPYVSLIENTGLTKQPALRRAILIKSSVSISDSDSSKHAGLSPSPTPWINIQIDFDSNVIGQQRISLPIDRTTFQSEIAPARTFGFVDQIDTLRAHGLALGASHSNTIAINGDRVENEGGLRYADEFVRHKALDCIGDLALAGAKIIGRFNGYRTGHRLNSALLRELMLRSECWEYTTLAEAQAFWDGMRPKTDGDTDDATSIKDVNSIMAGRKQSWR